MIFVISFITTANSLELSHMDDTSVVSIFFAKLPVFSIFEYAIDNYGCIWYNALRSLSEYYGSAAWKRDFAADEAGLLPQDLKRGVLSEDGVYDLIERYNDKFKWLWIKNFIIGQNNLEYHLTITAWEQKVNILKFPI